MKNDIINYIDILMQKYILIFKKNISSLPVGKPSTKIFENLIIDYHNTKISLNKISNIIVKDFKTVQITVFDISIIKIIEKSIITANLGFNPYVIGNNIFISFPILTTDRKNQIIKKFKIEGENAKIQIRNIRREGNEKIKLLYKEKNINLDIERFNLNQIQILTNKYILLIEKIIHEKITFIKKI